MTCRYTRVYLREVDGVGVIGLMVGLWVALSAPRRRTGQQDTSTVVLAWLLAALAILLLLTSLLARPSDSMSDVAPSTSGGGSSTHTGPYSVPGGQAVPGYGTIGNVDAVDTGASN